VEKLKYLKGGSTVGDPFCPFSGISWGFYIAISKKISEQRKQNFLFYQRYARLHFSFHFDFFFPSS